MGLFDAFKKKDCEICGKEVGLFGYKKLEDGEICKDCVKLLSPWFDDRRHSTVAQIKQQLIYREENRAALNTFRPTVAYGERYTLRAELVNGVPTRFVVERTDSYKEENADIISFRDGDSGICCHWYSADITHFLCCDLLGIRTYGIGRRSGCGRLLRANGRLCSPFL